MQNPLVYVVPKWTEICARDFKEGSERLCEVIIEGETKIYNFDAFTDETYHRLYDRQPNRLEDSDIKPENKIWIAIHQQMTELESFQQFSNDMIIIARQSLEKEVQGMSGDLDELLDLYLEK